MLLYVTITLICIQTLFMEANPIKKLQITDFDPKQTIGTGRIDRLESRDDGF